MRRYVAKTYVTNLFRMKIAHKAQKTANVTDATLVTYIRSIGPEVELRSNYLRLLALPCAYLKIRNGQSYAR